MESDQIKALLSELSPQEQQEFELLLHELKAVNGDISQLSRVHQATLTDLASRHLPQASESTSIATESALSGTVTATETSHSNEEEKPVPPLPDRLPTDTPFGQYVVEQVKTLCEGGSSLSDAIRYAFHNKYLPYGLREEEVCKDLLQRYQSDILTLADSFKSLESAHHADAKLLVGFAWFAVIYDCYQYIEAYGDLP